ncbi:MAG TPA: peptidase dimerization domain-containing protein, partial [Caldilineaceae bacterium]|nr:peptidase dimerization domain-containing protein [Caldilineaceae bacterium]
LLTSLDQKRLPVHILPVTEQMIGAIAETTAAPLSDTLGQLLDPAQTDATLDALEQQGIQQARMFDALLHNTVNATVVHGGSKTNVIPSRIEIELDGRLLPGFTPEDLMAEVRRSVGEPLSFEIIRHDPLGGETDMSLFPLLADILR